jgi:beta-lactam-binding protein with PASTA domain
MRTPTWLTVALAGAGGFLAGVLLVAILGGPKGTTKTTTERQTQTQTQTVTRTVDTRKQVPDVVDKSLPDARAALEGAGFKVDVVDNTLFGIVDEQNFVVTGQDPGAGSRLAPGEHVSVTVQRG